MEYVSYMDLKIENIFTKNEINDAFRFKMIIIVNLTTIEKRIFSFTRGNQRTIKSED